MQLYGWNWHFKKFLKEILEGLSLRVWVSNWYQDVLLAETMAVLEDLDMTIVILI